MKKYSLRILISLFVFFTALTVFAADDLSVGQVAQNVLGTVTIVYDFLQAICFVIGGSFIFGAVIKYFEHRRSPLMVPIGTPIFLLIAGILLVLLPFLALYVNTGM